MEPPRIDKYSFGEIVVDGISYNRDLVILPSGVFSNWWRLEGHKLHMEDIEDYLSKAVIDVLVIGTGINGVMKVTEEVLVEMKARGIEVVALRTPEACNLYNELRNRKRVMGVFHLTC